MGRPTHKFGVIDKCVYNYLNQLSHKLKHITWLHPNLITLSAYPFVILLLKTENERVMAFCILMICLIDCFDGEFARVSGKVSKFGDKLDHYTDRVTNCAYGYLFLSLFIEKSSALKISIAFQTVAALWTHYGKDLLNNPKTSIGALNKDLSGFYLVNRFVGACIYFYLRKKYKK